MLENHFSMILKYNDLNIIYNLNLNAACYHPNSFKQLKKRREPFTCYE